MKTKPILIALLISYILSIVFYAWSSLETTNRVNSVSRSMFDSSKTLLVWMFSLIFGWEKADWVATPVKLCGYIVVCIGVLIYNKIIKWIPYLRPVNKDGYKELEEFKSEIEEYM